MTMFSVRKCAGQIIRFFKLFRWAKLPVQGQLCWHHQTREDKWIEQDGTCMARFRCLDCDLSFTFHVIADPATWLEES